MAHCGKDIPGNLIHNSGGSSQRFFPEREASEPPPQSAAPGANCMKKEKGIYDQDSFAHLYVPCYLRETSRVWETVLGLGSRHIYKKGENFSFGKGDETFGYIRRGMTCCYYEDKYGNDNEIRFFLGSGCLIRETFILANLDFFITKHICLSHVELYTFDRSLLTDLKFVSEYPELLKNLIFSISIKSISLQLFATVLKYISNRQKVCHYLYGFYLYNGKRREFAPPFSQSYLADLLGLSKFTINRIIGKLKQEGVLISYTSRRVVIGDIKKLEELKSGAWERED